MRPFDPSGGVVAAPDLPPPSVRIDPSFGSPLARFIEEIRRDVGYAAWASDEPSPYGDLGAMVSRTCARLGIDLLPAERDEVLAAVRADRKPFGPVQRLVDDPEITDVIVSGFETVNVQKGRKNYKTSVGFPGQAAYEAFVERVLLHAKTTYSTKAPIADGMIGPYVRIHAVHKSVCDGGPYLTIRVNRLESSTPESLVARGVAPKQVFDYLTASVAAGRTLLVAGEVGTGKTTLARALASSVAPHESLLVIEDTPELRIEHPHVRSVTTRGDNAEGAGRVTPAECIRAGMRMAMNRIIFGEIRDAEAAEAFVDVCSSGHPGISTIHAKSAAEALVRLELFLGRRQPGAGRAALGEQIATAVQVLVHVDVCRATGARRIFEVRELGPFADGAVRQKVVYRYSLEGGRPVWEARSAEPPRGGAPR